jgi:hypothetical protein
VRTTPHAYKNVWIKFQGHYGGIGAVHNPFFTRFTRSEFINFSVWSDEQKIWQKNEYDNPLMTLFCLKRDSAVVAKVYELRRYDRVEIVGVVRNAFNSEPWIEVSEVRSIDGRVTTATLTHMARAWTFIEQHRWQQAAVELNLAARQKLTDNARGWLHGYLGLALMRLGRPKEAATQLAAAKGILKGEPQILEWSGVLERDPRSQVDTQVTMTEVRKGERPLWEAVDDKKGKAKKLGRTKTGGKKPTTRSNQLKDVGPVKLPRTEKSSNKTQGAAKPNK